ncbi:lytic transglycosylase domain-containing protein [Rhodopseudomonas pseudopalustris]
MILAVATAAAALIVANGAGQAQERLSDAAALLVVSTRPAAPSAFDAVSVSAPWAATIEQAAGENGLPPVFLRRLLHQESTMFNLAVSRAGAMGIAQFMPRTAAARGLDDPFDPQKAIPAAARYLSDLRRQFGNLGLAAAAYNAGSGRVSAWLSGTSELPAETRAYVMRITGFSAEDWAANKPDAAALRAAPPSAAIPQLHALKAEAGPKPSPKKKTTEAELCAAVSTAARACILQTVY